MGNGGGSEGIAALRLRIARLLGFSKWPVRLTATV